MYGSTKAPWTHTDAPHTHTHIHMNMTSVNFHANTYAHIPPPSYPHPIHTQTDSHEQKLTERYTQHSYNMYALSPRSPSTFLPTQRTFNITSSLSLFVHASPFQILHFQTVRSLQKGGKKGYTFTSSSASLQQVNPFHQLYSQHMRPSDTIFPSIRSSITPAIH